MNKYKSTNILIYVITALAVLLSGYSFYVLVRGFDPLYIFNVSNALLTNLPDSINSSYATFSHVLALSLFSYALLGAKHKFKIWVISFWMIINSLFELLQLQSTNFLNSGTYDNFDIIAILLAGVTFLIMTSTIDNKFSRNAVIKTNKSFSKFGLSFVGLFGIISIMASGGGNYETNPNEPVFLSYDELRGALKIETDRQLKKSGKIYLYQNLLLVSEPNIGIHIYDNTDPKNPIHKAFINLPGNLDIAVRNGYLYADSFIDLVTIDIRDLNNIVEVERVMDVFPYNAYQVVNRRDLGFNFLDRKQGVVIGFIKKPRLVFD